MRSKVLVSVAGMILVFAIVMTTTSGGAKDTYDQRINDLETRVAALETQAAMSSQKSGSNQQTNVTNSSSNSSVSSSDQGSTNSSSYTASFSANGDKELAVKIKNAGTYQLTVYAGSGFSAEIQTGDGNPLTDFSLASDKEGTLIRSAHLEPGNYILHVKASSMWNATIIRTGN